MKFNVKPQDTPQGVGQRTAKVHEQVLMSLLCINVSLYQMYTLFLREVAGVRE